ncbi:hypothetical protein ASD68_02935 [Rhodanobacter sp. Root627]|nr:hypothetical protein ASD68_02935 [Rhodanobacter sp. Root627]
MVERAFLSIPIALLTPVIYWLVYLAAMQLNFPVWLRTALLGAVAGGGFALTMRVIAGATTLRPKS